MSNPLTDDKLVSLLQSGVRQSVGYSDSRLSKERERVMRYYNGELPRPMHEGNSKYVSMDVWDGHESMKAQLLETMSGNFQPVTFTPTGAADVEIARIGTEMTNYVVMRQNPGFAIFRDVIDDSLLGRAGIAKVWWEDRVEEMPFEMTDTNYEELSQHIGQTPGSNITKVEEDEQGNIPRACISVKKDLSQVRILPLPPEEFFITGRSVDLKTAELVGHRYRRSLSELLKDGYDKKLLLTLQDNDNVWLSTEPELIERFQQTDDISTDQPQMETGEPFDKTVMVYETYAEWDMDGSGKKKLWQVIFVGDTILHKQPYNRKPFVVFVPLPRPHAFWGTSYDSLLVAIQNARTALQRSIIDHALITTNPRYEVAPGGLINPRELMENRVGGIVNVKRLGMVQPLPQGSLNPYVFQTITKLDEDKEQRTGISKLSQGLNKDAISKQNSADMVEQLVSTSQTRQKVIARNFAEGFLKDLYLEVYRLLCENETKARTIAIAGNYVAVDPTSWPERDELEVSFTLGYGEQQKEGEKFLKMDKYLQEAGIPRIYSPENRYAVIRKAMLSGGIKDVQTYITDPATLPPPQPDPMHLADIAVKQADAKVKLANAQAAVQKIQLDTQRMQMEHEFEMAKLALEKQRFTTQAQLEQDKLAHKITVDATEMQLQVEAQATAKLTAFAQPTR